MENKGSYVGNHGGVYTDIDGQTKQFTYVDHDIKAKKSFQPPMTEEETQILNTILKSNEDATIDEILALPAVSFLISGNMFAEDYIERHVVHGIIWREQMVRDSLRINPNLRYNIRNIVWKNTVKEQYWNDDMTHEDILKGEWKKWI